jgi:hypothetical protein
MYILAPNFIFIRILPFLIKKNILIYSIHVIFNFTQISIVALTYSDIKESDFYAEKLST